MHDTIHITISLNPVISSAVVNKRFVNKIGDKTAILRKYMSTKIIVYFFEKKGYI